MKKRIITLIMATSLMLTGCSLPFDKITGLLTGDDSSAEESVDAEDDAQEPEEDATDAATEASTEEAAEDADSSASAGTASQPLYKIVRRSMMAEYGGEAEGDNEYAKEYEGNPAVAGVYYQESLMVMDEYRDQFPELYDALYKIAENNKELYDKEARDFYQDALTNFRDRVLNGDKPSRSYVETEVYVKRTDDRYLSYYENIQYRWEETRPYIKLGHNIDITTGEDVDLGDVLNISEDDLNAIIAEDLREQEPEKLDKLENVEEVLSKYHYGTSTDGHDDRLYDWYFSVDGIHLVFNGYDLVDEFSFGSHEVLIPYDDSSVNEEYVYKPQGPYSYARTDMHIMSDSYYDGHVSSPTLMYTEDPDYEGLACGISVANGDEIATIDGPAFRRDALFYKVYDVFTEDGREYIYVVYNDVDDCGNLCVFEITDDGVKACGSDYYWRGHLGYYEDPDYYGDPCITDPDRMVMCINRRTMGCLYLYSFYRVGNDGMPEMTLDYYIVSGGSGDIRPKEDLEVIEVDKDGNAGKESTVKKGTSMYPVHTDALTYIDCQAEDGRVIRFTLSDVEDGIGHIDGVSMDDLFEGLEYTLY